jgi:hypothetical protein
MKLATVIKKDIDGKYVSLYIGSDRSEARKVYKENMSKKDTYQALFMTGSYESRSMSKFGFEVHNDSKMAPKKEAPKKKKKKKSED